MEHIFLCEYSLHDQNHAKALWYSVYETINSTELRFVGNICATDRYFMKGEPFQSTYIHNDKHTILFGANNKVCRRIDTVFDKSSSIFKDVQNILETVSKDPTIKSYGYYNEEIHPF